MNKKIARLVALAAFAVGTMQAGEMRSPYLSERGPLRYTFEKDDSEKYSLSLYTAMHRREAHKAFLDHGTDTKPLTALFFNKSDFPLREIFPVKSDELYKYQNFNPYVALAEIHPRATYYEWGMNLGGRFEYPVYKDKGRIGVRANIPFRTIEIEREDTSDQNLDPLDKYRVRKNIKINNVTTAVTSYRLDFMDTLYYFEGNALKQGIEFLNKKVKFLGNEVQASDLDQDSKSVKGMGISVGLINSKDRPEHVVGTTPLGFWSEEDVAKKNKADWLAHAIVQPTAQKIIFPAADKVDPVKKIAFFAAKYNDNVEPNYSTMKHDPDDFKNYWVVFGYDGGDPKANSPAGQTIKAVESWLNQFDDNPYEWLFKKGQFDFETQRRSGLGDIDLDLFYEHRFSDEWMAEVMLGVRAPTGSGDDYAHNPYKIHLGNSEHWEIKLGGMVAWMPLDWMNIKLDTYFAFALEATEHRAAAFKPDTDAVTTIKNIGPAVDADVDWQYFVLRLDFNLFHPKTNDLSSVIGYEFYYKTKDDVHFKKSSMETWLGKKWNNTSGGYVDAAEKDLDNGLLERNTQAIGHKIRCETSYRFSDWFEMFCGGSYTFAGRNLPRECDGHGGFNVRF